MGLRNTVLRRPRRLNKHNATLSRRRLKMRWLLAQRARVRNYRRFFHTQCEIAALAETKRQAGEQQQ
ncbi:hypothetical protein ACONUD_08995 [Microbulbifer harenosus]|uniref:50S ribosomal protein L20 n=1 Tax=Microbulbifer harenosus TaxID=2576840 RepID=A0ABY2UKY8_9GAMM|nr:MULTISPECIES: hypothetical protein [Microbulbifer]QIL88521.1 hypothetical protein GNX18_01095 [Microbulbifer sp. SH-1]TLM77039.1 hypothetical protein FDY93_11830 [Microbulbifer harenosus]